MTKFFSTIWLTSFLVWPSFAMPQGPNSSKQLLVVGAQLKAERQVLQAKLQNLHSWLQNEQGDDGLLAWRRFLESDALEESLSTKSPERLRLAEIRDHYRRNGLGLEREEFWGIRRSLDRLLNLLELQDEVDLTVASHKWNSRLESLLAKTQGSSSDRGEIVQLLQWLRPLEGISDVAATKLQEFTRPNVVGRVSLRLLPLLFTPKPIENATEINQQEKGIQTTGTLKTTGQLAVRTLPSKSEGRVILDFTGEMDAPNLKSQKRRVTTYAKSHGHLKAHKQLSLTIDGVREVSTAASADVDLSLKGISAPKFIRRLVERKAREALPEAERKAKLQAEKNLVQQLNNQAAPLIEVANRTYREKVLSQMEFFNVFPRSLQVMSDEKGLEFHGIVASENQVAAKLPAPPLVSEDAFSVAIHESFAGNFTQGYAGGKWESDEAFYGLLKNLTGEEPESLWPHDRSLRWSIKMAEIAPFSTEFRNGKVRIRISGSAAETGFGKVRNRVYGKLEIEAVYRTAIQKGRPVFHRHDPVTVKFTDSAVKEVLEAKFQVFFPEELKLENLTFANGSSADGLNRLMAREFLANDEWLSLRYELP